MPEIKDKYWDFYIQGREDRTLKHDVDVDELAKKLRAGDVAFRDAVLAACDAVAQPLSGGKAKRKWLDEHQEEIAQAGGSAEQAHAAWVKGRVDELAYMLEPDVINALADVGDGDEPDENDEEGEEEDDDDEED
jgi:hypothetical protein